MSEDLIASRERKKTRLSQKSRWKNAINYFETVLTERFLFTGKRRFLSLSLRRKEKKNNFLIRQSKQKRSVFGVCYCFVACTADSPLLCTLFVFQSYFWDAIKKRKEEEEEAINIWNASLPLLQQMISLEKTGSSERWLFSSYTQN